VVIISILLSSCSQESGRVMASACEDSGVEIACQEKWGGCSHHPVIRKQLSGFVIAPGVGQLGVWGGVLDLALLSPVVHAYQGGYSPPNFRAAISCISSREIVPYMSVVVW
jgi:hypothetical protein